MKADLTGKVALVTGSSAGIGRAAACGLAQQGARVIVHGLNSSRGQAVVSEINTAGGQAAWEPADLFDHAAVSSLVERAITRWGQVDILVANGGSQEVTPRPFAEVTIDELDRLVRSRYLARLYVTQMVLRHMVERRQGSIIVVTTDAGRYPTPGESLIGGIASALIMLTKTVARENARFGIRANCVAAALTRDTPGYEHAMSHEFGRRLFEKAEQKTPLGIADAADVAAAICYFASPAARRVTGQVISVNGGLSFGGW